MRFERTNPNSKAYISKVRLWRTDAGEVVEDGHPLASSLIISHGQTITLEEAERRGIAHLLNGESLVEKAVEAAPKDKAEHPSKDKAVKSSTNKDGSEQHFTPLQ